MANSYGLVILGGGPAGYEAAIRASQLGISAALVESREVGGTCLNRGCIPTKTILHAAELYREAKSFGEFGLSMENLSFDYAAVTKRKDDVVVRLRSGIEQLLKANRVDVYHGTGALLGGKTVRVSATDAEPVLLQAERILIAVGSVPAKPPIPGSDLPGVVTSDGLLGESGIFYPRLVIIGGGVIGMEFAAAFSSLGSEVTVLEALPRVLPLLDREFSQNLSMILKKRGVSIHTQATVERISQGGPLACTFTEKGESRTVEADGILIATGRKPNTANLFPSDCGIAVDRGYLSVDEHFETALPGVYAVGDAIRGAQLAHAASAQAVAAVEHMAGLKPEIHLEAIPSCVYTEPEIASVGLTADEAKGRNLEVKIGKALTASNGKSLITAQERGFVKLVFRAEDDVLLGAQLMCARATDMISELTDAVAHGLTARQLVSVIRPHPTFSEVITEAAADALGEAIHALPKRRL